MKTRVSTQKTTSYNKVFFNSYFRRQLVLKFILFFFLTGLGVKAGEADTVYMKYSPLVSRLEFSKDNSKILTAGGGCIMIFDTPTGNQIMKLPDGDGEYSKDCSLIAGVQQLRDSTNRIIGYNIHIYNAENYEVIKTIPLPQFTDVETVKIRLSPDNKTVALITRTKLYFVDILSSLVIKVIDQFTDLKGQLMLSDFLYNKDGMNLILSYSIDLGHGNYGGELIIINTQTYQIEYRNSIIGGIMSISDDGNFLATGTSSSGIAVSIMNTKTHEIVGQIPGNGAWVVSKCFSPDGQYLAVSSGDYKINIYQLSDFSIKKSIFLFGAAFYGLDITSDNNYLVGGASIVLFRFLATGIPEEKNAEDIIFPNPSDNSISVNFNLTKSSNLNFNLYDASGKLISSLKSGFYSNGLISEHLNLELIPSGTYFLKIESLLFNKTFKVIINR